MPPVIGGISVSSARLRDRLEKDGYEVDTYNLQIRIPRRIHGIWQLLNMLWLPFYVLGKRKYDIIHFHVSGYWRRVLVKYMKCFFKGSKTVLTLHCDLETMIDKHTFESLLEVHDHIICVRKGNKSLLSETLQNRTSEIPAFIMPDISEIAKMELPQPIASFIDKAKDMKLPILVFNGTIDNSESFVDLYGVKDMVSMVENLAGEGVKFSAMLILTDSYFDSSKLEFVKEIERQLYKYDNIKIFTKLQFSLLPVFASGNIIYVRPTKTDGDSLSIREALGLGAKVVASDVAPRPDEVVCYDHSHGVGALIEAVKNSLTDGETGMGIRDDSDLNNNYYKIIEVYNSLL